jgi:hypothetical protein
MALELHKLTGEVRALSQHAAQRLGEIEARMPAARRRLSAIGLADEALRRKVEQALPLRWAGAIPTDEPVDAIWPDPGSPPTRHNVLAADGSQIYPDRHGVALYYLINIGSIALRAGTGQAPVQVSQPELFYGDDALYERDGVQVPTYKIDAQRDLRELEALARLAQAERDAPTLALIDNGLLLYVTLQAQDQAYANRVLKEYLDHLDALQALGVCPTGIVDRPRAASVVRLLRLSELLAGQINEQTVRDLGPYVHLTDAVLFAQLAHGQRSALFVNASPANQDQYRQRGHTIYFFYLRSGQTLLRVELPEWVALDRARLDFVHATIIAQGALTGGFPYVLIRAHEIAVVTMAERREFETTLQSALIRQGLSPRISQKQQGKEWTRR